MAESKRTFQAARMDRDIDDRLLKPGQYRDGLNISIDTSEDANMGAIENLKGNELIANQNITGLSAASNPNAIVIASYPHPEEQKIYYFVTGDEYDGIFEYNILNNTVKTILIEGKQVSLTETPTSTEADPPEFNISAANISAAVKQDGTVFVTSKVGDPIPGTTKFPENTTSSPISRSVVVSLKIPDGFRNAGDLTEQTISVNQPAKTAPEVQTYNVLDITTNSAIIAGRLTNNSVGVTSQGFYYGYKTDGTALSISELKNGGTGITRFTLTNSNAATIDSDFAGRASSLVADKLISYAAFATNSVGTTDGAVKTFTTDSVSLSITALTFVNTTVSNAGGTENFVVTGTPGATYTLAGSSGATPPTGTQTIGPSGSNTHSVTISAQAAGASARNPSVTVTPTGSTSFLPSSLQSNDTISQAAGVAQTYTYALTPSTAIGNSTLKQGALSSASTYTGFTTTQTAGYSATETFYIFPDAGYEFASTSGVSITNLPSWASATLTQSVNASNHTFIQVDIAISNTPSNNDSVTYNIAATPTQVVTTWSSGLWSASTSPTASISPTGDSAISFTGVGTKTASDTISVTDSSKYISSVNSTTKNSTYGGDIITVSYSGVPTSSGGSLTVNFSIAIPADQRKSITYSSRPIAISLAGSTSTFLHRLTHNTSGSNFVISSQNYGTYQGLQLPQNSINYAAGATWYSYNVYVQPNPGYKFTSTSQVSLSGVPSWVTYSVSLGTSSFSDHAIITFNWTGQSSDTIDSLTISATPVGSVLTWNYNGSPSKMAIASHSSYTGSATMTIDGAGHSVIGPGPHFITLRGTYTNLEPSTITYAESSASASSTLKDQVSSNGSVTIFSPTDTNHPKGFEHSVRIDNTYRKDKTKTTSIGTIAYQVSN